MGFGSSPINKQIIEHKQALIYEPEEKGLHSERATSARTCTWCSYCQKVMGSSLRAGYKCADLYMV